MDKNAQCKNERCYNEVSYNKRESDENKSIEVIGAICSSSLICSDYLRVFKMARQYICIELFDAINLGSC
ncbi:hypothetical protein HMPREF9690_05049 [Raoultella ornithinolytica 10-5246]|nr:hypothetical protein HMPREF9690_05049 [Raoultella ornithinolytica 10-5246]